jgi:hypothetical protein
MEDGVAYAWGEATFWVIGVLAALAEVSCWQLHNGRLCSLINCSLVD